MDEINYNNFPQLSLELFSVFTEDGYTIQLSPAWEKIFGWTLEEIKTEHFSYYIHQEDLQKTNEMIERLKSTKQVTDFENRFLSKNGHVIHLLWKMNYNDAENLYYGFAKDITDLKAKEYFLTKSGQLAKIGGWRYSFLDKELDWTDETYKIHELSPTEHITVKKALSYYSGAHKKIIFKVFRDCYKGRSFSVNLRVQTAAHEKQKWVRINGEPQFINGKLRYIQGTYQDVNDEMLNKIKLIENEERYKFALEASNDFIWDWEISSDRVYFSEQLPKALGYEPLEFNDDFFLEILYPGDKDMLLSSVDEYLKNKDTFRIEFRIKKNTGEYRWFRSKGKALFDVSGNPYRMSGAFTDITEVKRKQLELKRALNRASSYQFGLNKVSIVISVDCMGKIIDVNEQFFKTTGYSKSDIEGYSFYFIFGDAYKKNELDKIWSSLKDGDTWEGTLKNKTKDGRDYWVDMYAVPLTQNVGEVCYMFMAHDKTKEIQTLNELEDEKIKTLQSSKLAAIGEMAGGIAHEINNPLAIIHGYASNMKILIEKNEIEASKKLQTKIMNTAERIAKIVKSLKAFSRSSENDNFLKVNFIDIINDTLTFCYEKLRYNNVELIITKPEDDCIVLCRQVEIAQVCLNLINNAFDAVKNSNLKKVEIKIDNNDQEFLKVSVIDSGHGVDPVIKEKVLNPFFTTKEMGSGTGLGLSISKKIIDSHDGVLDFNSMPGRTEFYFTLPIVKKTKLQEDSGL